MASIRKRTNSNGDIKYTAQVRLKGHPPEVASFSRLTDAKRWAQSIEAAIREGRHFKTSVAKQKTLGNTIDRYFQDVLSHRKNPVNQITYLKWWKQKIGDYALSDISASIIVEARDILVGSKNRYGREVGTTTANRYLQALGHVLNVAMNEWEWINENPVSRIKKFKEGRGRVRFLSDDEREALLKACQNSKNPYLYIIVILALSTGARKEEIIGLEWSEVHLERQLIILEETKNGERRSLPLKGHALSLMQQHMRKRIVGCKYVFPSLKFMKDQKTGKILYQPIDIRTAWENAIIAANIKDFRYHDLRHSAASYLAMNGASMMEIADILGHKTLQMV